MNREDLAWAAGFFDGEGCFARADHHPRAVIGNTHRGLLLRFRTIVGAGNISGPNVRPAKGFQRKPQWTYQLYSYERVQALAATLWTWLGDTKRAQAARTLRACRRRTNEADIRERIPAITESKMLVCRREGLAWAAGFFDGEGCFSHAKKSTMTARITHTDPDLLRRFLDVIGFGKIYGPYQHHGGFGSKKDRWVYATTGYEQLQAITGMLWFRLGREKRDKAEGILRRYLTHYACGHQRGDAPWHKHCPQCFRPGPKPGSRRRKRLARASAAQGA